MQDIRKLLGQKGGAIKEFRPEQLAAPQAPPLEQAEPDECSDADVRCAEWAASGECSKNAGFMRGSATGLGTCRAACGDCRVRWGRGEARLLCVRGREAVNRWPP